MKSQKLNSYGIFFLLCLMTVLLTGASSRPKISAWVIRWHIDSPAETARVCSEAQGNFTSLLVQARGRADAYYQSNIAPRAEELADSPDSFDPLASILDQCHSQKIQAWLNVYYLWTGDELPQDPNHPAQPETPWILEDNAGRKVSQYSALDQAQNWIEGTYADPASIAYQNIFIDVVDEIISTYQLDGIHLDFLRYPGAAFGHGGNLAAEFYRLWNFDPRLLPAVISKHDLTSWYEGSMKPNEQLLITGALLWAEMRANKVTELVYRVRKKLKETDPQLTLSAAVFPDYLDAYLKKGQDWQHWASEGYIDELYPMAYFGEKQRIRRQLIEFVKQTGDSKVKIWAGLGAYIKTAAKIQEETESIASLPFEGVSLFSLGHLQKKKGKILHYTKAVRQSLGRPKTNENGNHGAETDEKIFAIITNFQHSIRHENFADSAADAIITERLQDFSTASLSIIPQLIKKMEKEKLITPPWLDMHGIFRFIHPFDSQEKKQAQKSLCEQAKKEIEAGASMKKISQQFSQAGSRHFSSLLPRYYLRQDNQKDQDLLCLQPEQVSKIYEEENGYWFYKIIKKGEEETAHYADIPWPARRILFRQKILDFR